MGRLTSGRSRTLPVFAFMNAAAWLIPGTLPAQAGPGAKARVEAQASPEESPWLIVPTFSLNPKLGGAFGAMGAYLHYFDEKSRPSMFGVGAQYTTTNSAILSLFARASWNEDRDRVIGMVGGGKIRNDYEDYLGTGAPLKTNDEFSMFLGRYLHRVYGNWFLGAQGIYSNYQLLGESASDDQILDVLGLQGFKSGGLGFSLYHDSRDNESDAHKGVLLNVNNIAYRDWIAGSENFDIYRAELRAFFEHGNGHVLAVRQFNKLTSGAPPTAFAAVQLRGYKAGQYLGEYMSSLEVEERLRLGERWTSTIFLGTAYLYGDNPSDAAFDNPYPDVGAGVQLVIKKKEGIVANLETAFGKGGNYGIYIKLGYAY